MMLRALYELAQREKIDRDGRVLSLLPTRDEQGRAAERSVPRMPGRTVKVSPGFLFDKASYVLGLGPEGSKKGRNQECLTAFRAEIDRLAEQTQDEGAMAVARFYARQSGEMPKILASRPAEEWTGGEGLTFMLDGDDERMVHERPAVRAYWARVRTPDVEADVGAEQRCLVTGELSTPARMHTMIKRVPQAQSSGAALVSFNADAFSSQGLEQGANAPVSRAAAEGYATALNWLLEGTPERRFRYGVPMGDDAVTVFWTRDENNTADILATLFSPSPEQAVALAESPYKGLDPGDLDVTTFYAATLSGNAARVVVRDWLETTAANVKRNVRRYFDDLQIGHDMSIPASLNQLLRALESPGGRGLSPDLKARLFGAALRGHPLPREILGAALRRLRLPPDKDKNEERRQLRLRCSLIKATLLRLPRDGRAPMEVTVSLDENSSRVPYLLGRLFAVLERLQGEAQGDINATIRDRYFGAASSTPALVFPRLLRLSVHHAAKADGAGWLEKLKGRIISALPAEPFPRTLPLEDQGLFAVGYYHQRERFFEKRKVTPAGEASAEAEAEAASSKVDES